MTTTTTQPQPRIYVASKTKHAARWRDLRDAGRPIVSTWIDDPVDKTPGGKVDHADLWDRCVREAATAHAVVVYVESSNEVLKGAYVEVGAALARGVPVFLIGDPSGTCWHHKLVTRCETVDEAFRLALAAWLNGRQESEPETDSRDLSVREACASECETVARRLSNQSSPSIGYALRDARRDGALECARALRTRHLPGETDSIVQRNRKEG